MGLLFTVLKQGENVITGEGAETELICEAEKILGVQFSNEYFEYLSKYGVACVDGHELTGISKIERTNVVLTTLGARDLFCYVPADWYVVEQTGIDGIFVWQSQEGAVYLTLPETRPLRIANSLAEYLQNDAKTSG